MSLSDLIPFRKRHSGTEAVTVRHRAVDNPFVRLQDEMNRLFEDMLPATWRPSGRGLAGAAGTWDFLPEIEVRETRKEIEVSAELPGVEDKDLDVRLDGNLLTIRGEKRHETTQKEDEWTHTERSYGSFVRSIPLSTEVDGQKVRATFKGGVLKITLPKARPSEKETGRITVTTG